jgi:hypothetical protein
MSVRWNAWQSELEAVPPFAEEWNPGLAEEFAREVERIATRKRAERAAVEKLSVEVKAVHASNRQLLVFFDLERACARWSAERCPAADVERVLTAVAAWRERLLQFSGKFPPSDEEIQSLAALQLCIREAQSAADVIRDGFGALDACLAPRAAAAEGSAGGQATATEEDAAPDATPEAACAAAESVLAEAPEQANQPAGAPA